MRLGIISKRCFARSKNVRTLAAVQIQRGQKENRRMITPYYYAAQTLLECSEGTTKLNERATLLPVPEQGAEQRCSGGGSWASRSRGKRAVLSARQKRTSREPRGRAVRQARRRGKRRAAGRRELRGGRLLVGCDLREIAGGAEVTPPEVGRAASAQEKRGHRGALEPEHGCSKETAKHAERETRSLGDRKPGRQSDRKTRS